VASTRGATVEFRDVSKRYPGQLAVDQLSFKVPAGKICILVGPSGSGKTTSLKMVNRLIEPSAGSILIDGQDVLHKEPTALRRGIGYVIQQVGLFPHQTIADDRVDRTERLVHEHHRRLCGESSRDADALSLTAGELCRIAPREP